MKVQYLQGFFHKAWLVNYNRTSFFLCIVITQILQNSTARSFTKSIWVILIFWLLQIKFLKFCNWYFCFLNNFEGLWSCVVSAHWSLSQCWVFKSDCNIMHSLEKCMEFPVAPHVTRNCFHIFLRKN